MKLNKFKYAFMLGATLLLTGMGISSCDDSNDWSVDSSHDRLFRTNKLAVAPDLYSAEIEFKKTINTDYYIIEVSTDTLFSETGEELPMGGENAIVYGKEKEIKNTPYTIDKLTKDTKYYIRIKSVDNNGKESKWAYLEKGFFKTKKEQIVTEYVKTENSVTFSWQNGFQLTTIQVIAHLPEGETTEDIDISQDQDAINNHTYTISGLSPLTQYTIYLKNGDDIKGYIEFQTNAGIPTADKTIDLTGDMQFSQKLIDEYALESGVSASNRKTLTITFPADTEWYPHKVNGETGEITEEASGLEIPDGLSINFYGKGGGKKPILNIGGMGESGPSTTSLKLPGTHMAITFYNLVLDGTIVGTEGQTIRSFIDQGDACNIGTLSFDDCELRNYARCLLRLQKSTTKMINTIKVNNCLIHAFGGDNYSFMQAKNDEGSIDEIIITNSTFYAFVNPMKSFMQFDSSDDVKSVSIEDCTFYNLIADGQYFIDFNKTGTSTVTISRCIMGKTLGASAKGGRNSGTTTIIDSYKTSDWSQASNAIEGFIDYNGSAKTLFTSPDKGDFTITDLLFEGYNKVGDPRWYAEE